MNEGIETSGVSVDEAAVLTILSSSKLRIRDIAEILRHSHSGTVRSVSRLEDRGLVQKHPGDDRREIYLSLTQRGRELLERVRQKRGDFLKSVVDTIDQRLREGLEAVLESLLETLAESDLETFRICRLCDEEMCDQDICPVEQCYRGTWP